MNLEALRGPILDEHDDGIIAGEEDLVVRTRDLRGKVPGERDLCPAADQLDFAGLFQPAVESCDQAIFIHTSPAKLDATLEKPLSTADVRPGLPRVPMP